MGEARQAFLHLNSSRRSSRGPHGRLESPGLILLVTDSAFWQVPRAFVNLVKVLEIVSLRELYKESKVSCPRLILR